MQVLSSTIIDVLLWSFVDFKNVWVRSPIQLILVFLYTCLNKPRNPPGENLVCPAIINFNEISSNFPNSTTRRKNHIIALFLFWPPQLSHVRWSSFSFWKLWSCWVMQKNYCCISSFSRRGLSELRTFFFWVFSFIPNPKHIDFLWWQLDCLVNFILLFIDSFIDTISSHFKSFLSCKFCQDPIPKHHFLVFHVRTCI